MKDTVKKSKKSFVLNKEELKKKAIDTLRTSFEIEGVFFSDEQIQEMVAEATAA